jgi:hypothetical protein
MTVRCSIARDPSVARRAAVRAAGFLGLPPDGWGSGRTILPARSGS